MSKLQMMAYYYGFSETGVLAIDKILSAVASAGKAYHHTECWNDHDDDEPSETEKIQRAADEAAKLFKEKGL